MVGAGQAGLAVSRELTGAGVPHVVLERERVGESWRGRWDSFCLVTPNWTVQLPGMPYDGPDPEGFMLRDEVVAHLERYAEGAPVEEGVEVTSLEEAAGGRLRVETSAGAIEASDVVVCTGAYQRPHRPPGAATLPADLLQVDVEGYTNPGALPDGPVLVVGSGQSGCQIAEELCEAAREVFLACGRAPWLPRRIGEHDLAWWANESGYFDATIDSLATPAARLAANLQTSGRDGGHDLHFRTLRHIGVTLLGHFLGAEGRRARFAADLAESVAWGDERHAQFKDLVLKTAAARGLPAPDMPAPEPFGGEGPGELDLEGFGAVVFAGGYRPEYGSWVRAARAFDELGFPVHDECSSTAVRGLHFAGVHFLRKRKSSLLIGVGEDAAIVARRIAAGSLTSSPRQ